MRKRLLSIAWCIKNQRTRTGFCIKGIAYLPWYSSLSQKKLFRWLNLKQNSQITKSKEISFSVTFFDFWNSTDTLTTYIQCVNEKKIEITRPMQPYPSHCHSFSCALKLLLSFELVEEQKNIIVPIYIHSGVKDYKNVHDMYKVSNWVSVFLKTEGP